ncbi:DUF3617 domain-containing protein [Propionivibrio sp.]|uniref:DUF3617 domain-containing protein n=1 Tax=Propionivibrio sp. TaxID=2212460 RepID=UPI003BF16106
MKFQFDIRCTFSLLVFGLATASLAGAALAADMPKRKAGLWEITMRMEGAPGMGPMQQCIDQNTDNLMQQQAKNGKSDCSVMDVKPMGNMVTIHSVCKIEGSTATINGLFEGAFDSSYKGTMKTHYSPPLHGISVSNMTHEARWLGPCKPGQKPGDVVMPNMGGANINEMMKKQQH